MNIQKKLTVALVNKLWVTVQLKEYPDPLSGFLMKLEDRYILQDWELDEYPFYIADVIDVQFEET